MELKTRIYDTKVKLGAEIISFNEYQRSLNKLNDEIQKLQNEIADMQDAIDLCQLSLRSRGKIKEDIEQLATLMLQELFDDTFRFEFVPVYENEMLVGLNPQIFENDIPSNPGRFGGGACNVVGFAVRLLFIILKRELCNVLIWDEPFVNTDTVKWDEIIELLRAIQKDIPVQIIAITHSGKEFDQTFLVRRPNKYSIVEEL